MKRSAAVSLVLAGSAAALALSACKPKTENYATVQACVDAGRHTQLECEDAFTTAAREHEQSAPHFQNRADCLAAYGPDGCEERAGGGGSFFMPLMLGYMLGHGMGYHPLYQTPRGGGFGGARPSTGFGGGMGSASESSTVSRGGFGETGHGFGGGE